MPTPNRAYFSAALRRQVDVRRFTAGEVKALLKLLSEADRDLTDTLRERLLRLGPVTDFTSARYQAMLREIRGLRQAVVDQVAERTDRTFQAFGQHEAAIEVPLLRGAIPVEVAFATVSPTAIRAIVREQPFQGHLLREWFDNLLEREQRGLTRQLQLGLSLGETVPQIVRRVAGTREAGFTDGVLAISRRDAEAVVRTGINHVSNAAREEVWSANADLIAGLLWVSTLDNRTTLICIGNDGKMAPVEDAEGNLKPLPEEAEPLDPPEMRPPAHVGCRSTMVAVLDGEGIAANAVRPAKGAVDVGPVPGKTTYEEFLKDQPESFQDEVLGPERAELWRSGRVEIDQFVDRAGHELTLDQLRDRHPE